VAASRSALRVSNEEATLNVGSNGNEQHSTGARAIESGGERNNADPGGGTKYHEWSDHDHTGSPERGLPSTRCRSWGCQSMWCTRHRTPLYTHGAASGTKQQVSVRPTATPPSSQRRRRERSDEAVAYRRCPPGCDTAPPGSWCSCARWCRSRSGTRRRSTTKRAANGDNTDNGLV
jgi:hypothetical protein